MYAKARQDRGKELLCRTEQAVRCNDMVARTAQPHDQGKDRRHSGGRGNTRLSTFERGKTLLESCYGRIGKAGIDIAGSLAGETGRGLCCILENKARGQVERFGMLIELAAHLAGTHRQSLKLE